jgi:hypothetical protein
MDYGPLFRDYHQPYLVFMLRDVLEVANSFNGRASQARAKPRQHGWPPTRDYTEAVEEWNRALRNTYDALDRGNFLIIRYEKLFVERSVLDRLCHFLELPTTAKLVASYEAGMATRKTIEERRTQRLSPQQRSYVERRADLDAHRRLLDAAEARGII